MWDAARSGVEGFGALTGSGTAVSPCPRLPGVPWGACPSRHAARLAVPPRLCALLARFLPSVSNSSWPPLLPAFFQLKTTKKKKNPRHLLGVQLPEARALPCPAPAGWGAGRGWWVPMAPRIPHCPHSHGAQGRGLSCNTAVPRSSSCGPFSVEGVWGGLGTRPLGAMPCGEAVLGERSCWRGEGW